MFRFSTARPHDESPRGDAPQATDAAFMRLAIQAAREARSVGNMPYGAVLAQGARRLFIAADEATMSGDCTAHAEMVLLRKAAALLGTQALRGCTVYASAEPCAMCTGAMFWAGIHRVVFGATSEDVELALGGPTLPGRGADLLGGARSPLRIEGPLLREEAVAALKRPTLIPPALAT